MKHLLLALAALLSGCTYTASFNSHPQGARVYVDGVFYGITPFTHEMEDRGQSGYYVRFELEGHQVEGGMIRPVATGQTFTTTSGTTTTTTQAYGTATVRQPNPGGRVYGNAQATTVQTQATNQTTQTHQVKSWPRDIFANMRPLPPGSPQAEQAAPAATNSSFCTSCGSKTAGKFCGACGSPTGK